MKWKKTRVHVWQSFILSYSPGCLCVSVFNSCYACYSMWFHYGWQMFCIFIGIEVIHRYRFVFICIYLWRSVVRTFFARFSEWIQFYFVVSYSVLNVSFGWNLSNFSFHFILKNCFYKWKWDDDIGNGMENVFDSINRIKEHHLEL